MSMNKTDTSAEAVERLAKGLEDMARREPYLGTAGVSARAQDAADTLRALAAERYTLREALADLMSWFPDKPSPPEWRFRGGEYGADEAVKAARAALGDAP